MSKQSCDGLVLSYWWFSLQVQRLRVQSPKLIIHVWRTQYSACDLNTVRGKKFKSQNQGVGKISKNLNFIYQCKLLLLYTFTLNFYYETISLCISTPTFTGNSSTCNKYQMFTYSTTNYYFLHNFGVRVVLALYFYYSTISYTI